MIRNRGTRSFVIPQFQVSRRLPAQREFRSIYAIHARIAARRRMSSHDAGSGQESQLHQPQGLIFGQIQTVQNAMFAPAKLGKRARTPSLGATFTFDTQLHRSFSMRPKARVVKAMETVVNDSQLQLAR